MQTWALIVDSFRESRDKRLFWVLLVVSTVVGLGLICINATETGWSLFFGAVELPFPAQVQGMFDPAAVMAGVVVHFLIDVYIGWLGTVACLVATAGFIPNFLARGGVDVVLGKPMSRVHVLLGKYVGSLSFVAVQAGYFVLLTFFMLRVQTGHWFWGYLWAAPLLVLLFSYLYCICTLAALITRSTLTSLILTLLFWVGAAGITMADALMSIKDMRPAGASARQTWDERGSAGKALHVVRWVLPKTSDVPILVARQMDAANLAELALRTMDQGDSSRTNPVSTDEAVDIEEAFAEDVSFTTSIGSSLAFEAVVLILACAIFSRRDF